MASEESSAEEHSHQHFNCCCSGTCATMFQSSLEKVNSSITEVHNKLNQVLSLLQKSALLPTISTMSSLTPDHGESSTPGDSYRLSFKGELPNEMLTNNKIEEEGASLEVELLDEFGKRVEVGLDSGVKIKIDVLDGDFIADEDKDWTEEKFKENIARPRKYRGPLLKGNTKFPLNAGVADVCGFSFTDNSSSMRNGTFRFGAQLIGGLSSGRFVRSAVSNKEFRVKESRLKSDRKHSTPSPEDDLWRLKNINKSGPVRRRAMENKIYKVKDFLQLYHTDEKKMKAILGVPESKWDVIVTNAKACKLTNEQYQYYDDESGDVLILDCAFNIKRVTFKGRTTQPYEYLDLTHKEKADKLRRSAYEKRNKLEIIVPVPTQELPYPSSAQQQEQQKGQEQPAAAPPPSSGLSVGCLVQNMGASISSDQLYCDLPMQYSDSAETYQDDLWQNLDFSTESSACLMTSVSGDYNPSVAVNVPVQMSDHRLDKSTSLSPEKSPASYFCNNISGMQQMDYFASLSTNSSGSIDDKFIADLLSGSEANDEDLQPLSSPNELRNKTPSSRHWVKWRRIRVQLTFLVRLRRIDDYRPLKKQKT